MGQITITEGATEFALGTLTNSEVSGERLKTKHKYSLLFDGTNDNIPGITLTGFPATSTSIYIAMWAMPKQAGTNALLQTQTYSVTNNISILFPWIDSLIYWDFGNASAGPFFGRLTTTMQAGWLNVMAFWEFEAVIGSHMKIHRNLTEIATKSVTSATGYTKGANTLSVGGVTGAFARVNIAMFAVLSATPSVPNRTLLKNTITGSESGLLIGYNMSEGTGTSLNDMSANNNDGTISGATWQTDALLYYPSSIRSYSSYALNIGTY